jgi:zinc protease
MSSHLPSARPRAGAVLSLALLGLLALPGAAPAGALAHREVLPNGITLLVAERPAVPIVAARVFTGAGAVLDPPGREGLANLTGEVLTRGTARRTGPELDAAIEFVGGSLEARAGRDGLTLSLGVLQRDLDLGFDLLAEVLLSPAFPAAEVGRKVAEIQAAIQRSEQDPRVVGGRALARLTFPDHPYGTPVVGTVESVGRLTRADVARFYGEHVRPDTTVVVVVGAVTVAEARRVVGARLGGWTAPPAPQPPVPPPGSAPPATETIERKDLTQATVLLGRQAIDQTHPDYFALRVATQVLGGGAASRLYTRVRDEGGLAYAVSSSLAPGKHGSSVVVGAQTRTEEVPHLLDLVVRELDRLTREPASEAELALARDYLIGSFPLRLDTSGKVADFLVALEVMGLGLDYLDRYRAGVAAVTAADVRRVAARYLAPGTFHRVIVGAVPAGGGGS